MAEYVYLFDVGGERTASTFATFDDNRLSTLAELELSRLQVTANSAGVGQAGATLTATSGKHYIECVFHGFDALNSSTRIGFSDADTLTASQLPGSIFSSTGFAPGSGVLYSEGSSVQICEPVPKGAVISLCLDIDTGFYQILVNGAQVYIAEIGQFPDINLRVWLSVSCASGFGLRGFVNFGQRAFEYEPPAGFSSGLFELGAVMPIVRFAEQSITLDFEDDALPNVHYSGRVLQGSKFPTRREVSTWTTGKTASRVGTGEVVVINTDGEYQGLVSDDYRDQPVIVRRLRKGADSTIAVQVAEMVVDRARSDGATVRLSMKDKIAKLDVAFQRRLFLPNVADSAANQPYPALLGTARSIPPVIYDEATRAYAITDRTIDRIGVIRDKGDPLDPSGSPEDWSYNETSTGFVLRNDPQGKLTVDASSVGSAGDQDAVDILGGIGNPFSGGSNVAGFVDSDGTFSGEPYGAEETGGKLRLFYGPSGPVTANAGVNPTVGPCTIGAVYRARISIEEISYHAGNRGITVYLAGNVGSLIYATMTAVGNYTITFTAQSEDVFLTSAQAVAGGDSNQRAAVIAKFTLEDVAAEVISAYDEVIPGIGLEDFAREVIENRAGLTSDDWSPTSAAAVDDGYDVGVFIAQAQTCRQVLDAVMDTYSASYWQDRVGKIRFGRMRDPNRVVSPDTDYDWSFDESNMLGRPSIYIDTAPGLSTSITCRRNWSVYSDGEFVTDTVDVPLALRARLSRQYQFTRTSSANLAQAYKHAVVNDPVVSYTDDPDQGQAEINRVCDMFPVLRYWIEFDVPVTDLNEFTAEPFETMLVSYPDEPLLSAGKLFEIRAVEFDGETVKFLGWG